MNRIISHVIFLAGGEGKRLREVTQTVGKPKQLLPIRGRSSFEHGVGVVSSTLPSARLHCVVSPQWLDLFERTNNEVTYHIQQSPLGNAHALFQALMGIQRSSIQDSSEEGILIFNGDSMRDLRREHVFSIEDSFNHGSWSAITMLRSGNHQKYVWNVNNDGLVVSRTHEPDSRFQPGSFIGVIASEAGSLYQETQREVSAAMDRRDEAKITNIALSLASRGSLGALLVDDHFCDINTPQDYMRLQTI